MRRLKSLALLIVLFLVLLPLEAQAQRTAGSERRVLYRTEPHGPSADIVAGHGGVCRSLVEAMRIAQRNAKKNSVRLCWRYVKKALVEAAVVDRYPGQTFARDAGAELTDRFGFVRLAHVRKPEQAPVGSIIVYGGNGPGHVEFRTPNGFVSDFFSSTPSPRPMTGVYIKRPGSLRQASR
ncbi:MAG: hypothetical protein ACFCU3_06010 [Verrucomicrobiales bacterium]